MKTFSKKTGQTHSADALSALLLFVFFVLFLLLLMLFSAEAYRTAVRGQQQNNNLYTAQAYLTTKFRQYDTAGSISADTLDGIPSLKFTEEIDGEAFDTWLYLYDGELRELFTSAAAQADPALGTGIAELSVFTPSFSENGFVEILLEDPDGNTASLLLHCGVPDFS